jgi:hypothetical protein
MVNHLHGLLCSKHECGLWVRKRGVRMSRYTTAQCSGPKRYSPCGATARCTAQSEAASTSIALP